ncbi:hypothetical protein GN956_G12331 [Arapaima gigas]
MGEEENTVSEVQLDDEAPSTSSPARVLPVSSERSESSWGESAPTEEENHVTRGYDEPTGEQTLEQSSNSEREQVHNLRSLSWRSRGTRRFQYHSPSQLVSNRRRVSLPHYQWQRHHMFRDRSHGRGWNQSPSETVHENQAAEMIWNAHRDGQAQFASAASEHRSSSSVRSSLPLHDAWRIEEVPESEVSVDDETPSSSSSVRVLPVSNERSEQRQCIFAEEEDSRNRDSTEPTAEQTPELALESEGERVQLHNDPDLSWRARGPRRSRYHCTSHSLSNWRTGSLPYNLQRMHPLSFHHRSDWRRWNQSPNVTFRENQSADTSHGSRMERETPSENISNSLVWSTLPSHNDWTREENIARNMSMNETPGPSSSARTLPIFNERSESGQRQGVSAEEDCIIVNYVEPTVARNPGLVSGSGGVHAKKLPISGNRSELGQRVGVFAEEEDSIIVGYVGSTAKQMTEQSSKSEGAYVQFHKLPFLSWREVSTRKSQC